MYPSEVRNNFLSVIATIVQCDSVVQIYQLVKDLTHNSFTVCIFETTIFLATGKVTTALKAIFVYESFQSNIILLQIAYY